MGAGHAHAERWNVLSSLREEVDGQFRLGLITSSCSGHPQTRLVFAPASRVPPGKSAIRAGSGGRVLSGGRGGRKASGSRPQPPQETRDTMRTHAPAPVRGPGKPRTLGTPPRAPRPAPRSPRSWPRRCCHHCPRSWQRVCSETRVRNALKSGRQGPKRRHEAAVPVGQGSALTENPQNWPRCRNKAPSVCSLPSPSLSFAFSSFS